MPVQAVMNSIWSQTVKLPQLLLAVGANQWVSGNGTVPTRASGCEGDYRISK